MVYVIASPIWASVPSRTISASPGSRGSSSWKKADVDASCQFHVDRVGNGASHVTDVIIEVQSLMSI